MAWFATVRRIVRVGAAASPRPARGPPHRPRRRLTAALEESDIPPDLKQWWDRMLATKAVARLKGAGIKLMPSSTGTGW